MQVARNYVVQAVIHTEQAIGRMQPAVQFRQAGRASLPITRQEITCYVEQLLTFEEQRVCDMATD